MRTGLTFPGAFDIVMREHMVRWGTTREQIGLVSVKNHDFGAANPKAQFRKPVTLDEVFASRLIADPIRLFDCPLISDGADAAVLCPAEWARDFGAKPVRVLGTGHGGALGERRHHVVPRDGRPVARGLCAGGHHRGGRGRRRGPRLLHDLMLDDKRCAECRRLGVGTGACPFCGSASGTVERLSRRARLLS